MQIRFNLASSQTAFYHLLRNLDNGARCTETSVFITYISCLMYSQISSHKNAHDLEKSEWLIKRWTLSKATNRSPLRTCMDSTSGNVYYFLAVQGKGLGGGVYWGSTWCKGVYWKRGAFTGQDAHLNGLCVCWSVCYFLFSTSPFVL